MSAIPSERFIRFELFGGAHARRGGEDPALGLRDYVEMCVEAEALGYGTPDQIAAVIVSLRAVGVQRILIFGGGATRQTIRRFAAEIMPAFTCAD